MTGLCTLAEAKTQLNMGSGTTSDAELQTFIDAVTAPVELYCGEILPATVTNERHYPEGPRIFLRSERASAITSVTEFQGTAPQVYTKIDLPSSASSYTYVVDGPDGVILTRLGGDGRPFCFGNPVYVTYTAGFAAVPAAIGKAAQIIVQHLWQTQRGPNPLPLQPGAEVVQVPGWSFAIPQRAKELLDPYRRAPLV